MAQWDLLLTQNVHATLVEYSEKFVNLDKGDILSADASQVPTVLPAGTDGYMLVRDDAETTGLNWQAVSGGHTQGTDLGTTSLVFGIDTDGYDIELTAVSASKFDINVSGGASKADLEANDATFNTVTVSTAPSAGTDLTNKTYVDGLLAANDAMVYKGTVGSGGTLTIAAHNALTTYNAGDTWKVIEASADLWGNVVEIGDMIIAIVDRTGSGNDDADWTVVQANIDGAVIGPASSTDGYFAIWDGTTGVLLKDGTGAPGSMAYETATDYLALSTFTAGGQILYSTGSAAVAVLASGTGGDYLASGGTGAPTWETPGTMIGETATDYVANALFDAQTVLAATTDNTPAAVTVAEQTVVGRITSGNITALTGTQVMGILWSSAPATPTSTGTVNQMAYDEDYFYVCVATDTWRRTALSTNWT